MASVKAFESYLKRLLLCKTEEDFAVVTGEADFAYQHEKITFDQLDIILKIARRFNKD